MQIRKYEPKDADALRYVCLYCDGFEKYSDDTKKFILSTYCDYYIEIEPENCFVAADENDKAIGYVMCSENADRFLDIFNREYFTRISESHTSGRYYARESVVPIEKHKDEYPAHLHIDILREYQRQGIGHRLLDALFEHLENIGVRGIMLSMSAGNEKAAAFYDKYGFTLIEKSEDTLIYGKKIK